jgi:hypothetical protein
MDWAKLQVVMQIIQGVAGMLSSIFQSAQSGATVPPNVAPHVQIIHEAARSLSVTPQSKV